MSANSPEEIIMQNIVFWKQTVTISEITLFSLPKLENAKQISVGYSWSLCKTYLNTKSMSKVIRKKKNQPENKVIIKKYLNSTDN